MDRRFIIFMVLSLLILTVNSLFIAQKRQAARPAANVAAEADRKVAAGDDSDDAADADAPARDLTEDASEEKPAATDDALAEERAEAIKEDAEDAAVGAEPDPDLEYVTLGSIDKDSGFRMLVTLTNQGAGVRRLELSSPRYLDIHDRGGYLGHLELAADNESGLLVRAVGAGTPAAAAGLEVGDRLLSAGEKQIKPVASAAELEARLAKSRPGRTFSLKVARGDGQPTLEATLARRPLEVIRPESANVHLRGKQVAGGFVEPASFLLTLDAAGDRKLDDGDAELRGVRLLNRNWRIAERDDESVTFTREVPDLDLTITKRYRLAKAEGESVVDIDAPVYHLVLEVTIANGSDDATRRAAYRLDGPNGLPVEGWWYLNKVGRSRGLAGMRDVVGRYFGGDPQQQSASAIVSGGATAFEGDSLAYIGVDSQYFAVAMLPLKAEDEPGWTSAARPIVYGPSGEGRPVEEDRFANVSFRLIGKPLELDAGESVTHSYQIYAGPKRPDLVEQYAAADNPSYTLGDFCYYGWFGAIATAMLSILHGFYAIVGNYGVAIVLLTMLVRGAMFPISRGQAKSMAKLQELRPEMDKIKERFKGDQQKQAQEMQKLYRKHGVNPVAGCLPVFLQLPVFFGLYRGLAVDIELRQSPLLGSFVRWCSNLAAPDMFLDWSRIMPASVNSGEGILGLGPYLNLLPLVTIVLFLWQQKMMMPPAADEQARMQQTIMKYMSIFFSILFYKVPSGLCVYMITSSLWGIAERKLVPPIKPGDSTGGAATKPDSAAKRIVAGLDSRTSSNGQTGGRSQKPKRRK